MRGSFCSFVAAWCVLSFVGTTAQSQDIPKDASKIEKKIYRGLDDIAHIEFINVPLRDAVEVLKDSHQIPIVIDVAALREKKLAPERVPVTKNIKDKPLREALKLMLADLDLTFIVKDDAVRITTKEVAEKAKKAK